MSRAQQAEMAYMIETQRMEAPIGKQDQYAAAFSAGSTASSSAPRAYA